jgi:long-chain acyl-CoA synthetase
MSTTTTPLLIEDERVCWTRAQFDAAVSTCAAQLAAAAPSGRIATLIDNSAAWAVLDRACAQAGLVHVPLPGFFTAAQVQHALQAGGVGTLVTESRAGEPANLTVATRALRLTHQSHAAYAVPAGTSKITFTSGTTGTPKGVCLGEAALQRVAEGLAEALRPLHITRHLCALPLPVLLENIAGLLAPFVVGATCVIRPLHELGLTGSSRFDPAAFDRAVRTHEPHSLVLLPQMLRAWAGWLHASRQPAPASLRFVAVGGAAVGPKLLALARAVGLPAYEGYGLSEAASVQTLNLPGADRPGSVGRPLPHARVRLNTSGEVEIAGSLFLGYTGEPVAPISEWLPTGDLGTLDADGFLHLQGRRKHVLITAYGRNVSPEWVETALRDEPAVLQAVVFGDGEPALWAVLWPVDPQADDTVLDVAVAAANQTLPDYARIGRWVRAAAPFDAASGLATPNGRPRREAIERLHATSTSLITTDMTFHDQLGFDTTGARSMLLSAPIIHACLQGRVSLPSYLEFLTQAYHHVRHTVPLLQACRAALPPRLAWMQPALDEYIAEEAGHDEWILDDIRAAGGDAEAVRHGAPGQATEVMVAYAYDAIARRHPLMFLGMVYVLEGTSVSLALMAADQIQQALGLPDKAFTYLRSHGTLDREHVDHYAELVNRLTSEDDKAAVVHAANVFFKLYGDVFRGLPMPQAEAVA